MSDPRDLRSCMTIEPGPLGHTLILACPEPSDARFASAGIEPTGHFWEHAVRQVAAEQAVDLASVTFDCESDYFVAYAPSERFLKAISNLLHRVHDDDNLLGRCLDSYEPGDAWTLSDLVEGLVWSDEDSKVRQDLGVFFGFEDHADVLAALPALHEVARTCYYDREPHGVLAAIRLSEFVTYEALRPIVDDMSKLATQLGGRLDSIDPWDGLDTDADHWVRFEGG